MSSGGEMMQSYFVGASTANPVAGSTRGGSHDSF
jgi:hypothetical protein